MTHEDTKTRGLEEPHDKVKTEIVDGFQVWDERANDFLFAYRRDIRRRITHIFIDGITFNDVTSTKTSDAFLTEPYEKMGFGTLSIFLGLLRPTTTVARSSVVSRTLSTCWRKQHQTSRTLGEDFSSRTISANWILSLVRAKSSCQSTGKLLSPWSPRRTSRRLWRRSC